MENLLISEFISNVATLPTCLLSRRDRGRVGGMFLAAWSDVFLKNGHLLDFYMLLTRKKLSKNPPPPRPIPYR